MGEEGRGQLGEENRAGRQKESGFRWHDGVMKRNRILSRETWGNALNVCKCFGQERKLEEEEEEQASQGRVSVF